MTSARSCSGEEMPKPPLPSGAEMWAKSDSVKLRVHQLLVAIPGTRGDDRLLEIFYRVRYEGWKPWRAMPMNDAIQMVRRWMSPDTLVRRRQEIQNALNPDGSYRYPHLRPTKRTARKRETREEAVHNYYGGGYRLTDFESGEQEGYDGAQVRPTEPDARPEKQGPEKTNQGGIE